MLRTHYGSYNSRINKYSKQMTALESCCKKKKKVVAENSKYYLHLHDAYQPKNKVAGRRLLPYFYLPNFT